MKLTRWLFSICLLLITSSAHSFAIQLTESQINGLLTAYFPVSFNYEYADIQLTEANLVIKGKNKRLQVNAHINAQQQNNFIRGTVSIDGEIAYDKSSQKLQIIEPRLIHANIKESSFNKKDINTWLQQAFNQSLPIIVLLDFKKLNFQGLTIQPNKIEVLDNSILIEI
ncbi:DUF1439 domain-containing protein [Catenovulum agarivorans]|uniref:DUF1439 domain-containing protein n=1 Tax=Catenovulum agarivorans TaxID=1172192 RepID=UPI000382DB37|nr:DUF1439 domain-containing protein [Catenovulum agarivorans]